MPVISLALVLTLLVAHYVGDFELQTDKMALRKSKSNRALLAHVYTVTSTYAVFTLPWALSMASQGVRPMLPWIAFVAINFVVHFCVDWVTSRMTSKLWFITGAQLHPLTRANVVAYAINNPNANLRVSAEVVLREIDNGGFELTTNDYRHRFFCTIGADQAIHYVTLFLTAWWLLA